jgi:hypothetical protein
VCILSLAEEDVTFPRMNYQRKQISLKERLDEALEEIGDESLQGPEFEREMREERFCEIEPGTPELRQRHPQASLGMRYRQV